MWASLHGIVTDNLLGLWSSLYPGMLVMRPWICGNGTTTRTGIIAFPVEY